MAQYLYAAAVQGIQDFIFDTNKLQEIAGASEIVEQICTTKFAEILGKKNAEELAKDPNLLVGAAGNIKYLFEDKNENQCKDVVLRFPFEVAKMAPGITISQTVVKIEEGEEISNSHIDTAEKQLQTQRNLAARPGNLTRMIARRVPKTGKAAVAYFNEKTNEETTHEKSNTTIDLASKLKREENKKANKALFTKVVPENYWDLITLEQRPEKIVSDDNSWIAVVHADGNDLGKLIPTFFEGGIKGQELITRQRNFSQLLDISTRNAAKTAFNYVLENVNLNLADAIVPFRPIVCGGDDLTIIVQAKFALDFTRIFLEEFTKETKTNFAGSGIPNLKNGLTACAGIAYVKQKYPFHYAVDLAGELCSHAKKVAKKLNQKNTPACLSFYKIESAFVRKFDDKEDNNGILQTELESTGVGRLTQCPYMLENVEGHPTIKKLQDWLCKAKNEQNKAVTARLRQLLSMFHTQNKEAILIELKRIKQIFKGDLIKDFGIDVQAINEDKFPNLSHLHDFLSINSINE